MFRSPGVRGVGCYSDLFLLSELFFGGFKLLNLFLVSRFFPNYFTGAYANLSRYFFGYVNFHRNFGGV